MGLVATPLGPTVLSASLESQLRTTGYVSSINGKQGAVELDISGGGTESVGGISPNEFGDVPIFKSPGGTIQVATPDQYGNGSGGTDWHVEIDAVLAAGKCLVGKYQKAYPTSGRHTVPEGAYFGGFGSGAKGVDLGSTTFKATAAGAGFDFIDGGHTIQDVMIDGNSIATQPCHFGSSDTSHVGAQPIIRGLTVKNAATGDAAFWAQGTQNGWSFGLRLLNNAGASLKFTDHAGGWNFYGTEVTGGGDNNILSDNSGNNNFWGGIFERALSGTESDAEDTGAVWFPDLRFNGCTFSSGGSNVGPTLVHAAATLTASTDRVGWGTAHGLCSGMPVKLANIVTATGVDTSTQYYVINPTTNDFQLCATQYGTTPVDITADGTADVNKYIRYLYEHRGVGVVEFNSCAFAGITNEVAVGVFGGGAVASFSGVSYFTGAGMIAFLDGDASGVVEMPGVVRGQVAPYGPVPLHTSNLPFANIAHYSQTQLTISRTSSALPYLSLFQQGQAFAQAQLNGAGTISWGSGTGAFDTIIGRASAGLLGLTGGLTMTGKTTCTGYRDTRHDQTASADGTLTLDADNFDMHHIFMNGHNVTLAISGGSITQKLYVYVQQNASPGTLTLPLLAQSVEWTGGDAGKPPLTSATGWLTFVLECVAVVSGVGVWVERSRGGTNVVLGATGALLAANNLNDVADASTSRYNLHVPILSSVQAVATANVASLSGTTTIDGVALAAGDPVLLTAQTTGSQNGPWLVQSGAWTRPLDYPAAGSVKGRCIHVNGGSTANAGSMWVLKTTTTVTIDTTATTWAQANSGAYLATAVLAALSTGVLKSTTGTGALSIATAADIPTAAPGSTGPLSATSGAAVKPVNFQAPSGWFVLPCGICTSSATAWTTANKGIATWCAIDLEPGKTYNLLGVRVASTAQVGGTTTTTLGLYGDLDGIPDLAGGILASGTVTLTATGNRTCSISYTPTKVRHWVACLYVETVAPSTYPSVHQISVGLMVATATIGSNARGYFASSLAALPTTAITLSDQTTPVVVAVGAA